jgi:hypothetical protein
MGNRERGTGKREFSPLFTFTFFLHLKLSKLSKPPEPSKPSKPSQPISWSRLCRKKLELSTVHLHLFPSPLHLYTAKGKYEKFSDGENLHQLSVACMVLQKCTFASLR